VGRREDPSQECNEEAIDLYAKMKICFVSNVECTEIIVMSNNNNNIIVDITKIFDK